MGLPSFEKRSKEAWVPNPGTEPGAFGVAIFATIFLQLSQPVKSRILQIVYRFILV